MGNSIGYHARVSNSITVSQKRGGSKNVQRCVFVCVGGGGSIVKSIY